MEQTTIDLLTRIADALERLAPSRVAAVDLTQADAFEAAWLPGTEGDGVADVLFGDYKPTGKLPYSWPRSMAQIPINVGGAGYDPLFPFGYGLSY